MQAQRKHLSTESLIHTAREEFKKIKHPLNRSSYTIEDCLSGGLAIFGLKYPSLLQVIQDLNDPIESHNLKQLYQIKDIPSDTHFRVIADDIEYSRLNYVYDVLISKLQRGRCLFDYRYLDNYYLVSIDGTGYFSSDTIHCKNCCIKTSSKGKVTYYHQALSAVLVHPDFKQVFPVGVEPIIKQNNSSKNDCERNAVVRLLNRLRTSHPNFKFIVTLDALYVTVNIIKLLQELDMCFIITAKNLPYMYDCHKYGAKAQSYQKVNGELSSYYSFSNQVPLYEANQDIRVNFIEYAEVGKKNKYMSSWITDIEITKENMHNITKGGRARWKIENETFNTLKHHGYNFEHNFGHGNNNLSIVLCHLMFIAFLIDQIQESYGYYFKKLKQLMYSRKYLWQKLRVAFCSIKFNSWEELYIHLIERYSKVFGKTAVLNSS